MKILNIFDAVRDGTFQDFKNFYEGNINVISGNLDLNLLCMAVTNDKNPEEKLQIIKFLFAEGIDVNYA
ncbi:ankyrin repeat domain-containing protein, partial [Lactiplantibacillus plantarum]|nr:ankyrin repeat domain-containing protein [Lactiplantibacillus plantarum]